MTQRQPAVLVFEIPESDYDIREFSSTHSVIKERNTPYLTVTEVCEYEIGDFYFADGTQVAIDDILGLDTLYRIEFPDARK
jgi:hypothetical protein